MSEHNPLRPVSSDTPGIDPERLAALIEGKASDAERAELLARLDASPELLEAFTDAVAVQDSLTAEAVTAIRRKERAPWNPRALAAIAAAAAIVLVAWPLVRGSRPGTMPQPASLVALLGPGASTIAADPGWRTTRTAGAAAAELDARATRIGAYLVELGARAAAGDTLAGSVARAIANLLSDVPAAAAVERAFRELPAVPAPSAIASMELQAEALMGSASVRAGAWLQAARVAAAERRGQFFANDAGTLAVRELQRQASTVSRRSALADLQRILGTEARDWTVLANALARALLEFGN